MTRRKPPPDPQWFLGPSGLVLPIEYLGSHAHVPHEPVGVQRVGTVPLYEEIWTGSPPDLARAYRHVPLQSWIGILTSMLAVLAHPGSGRRAQQNALLQLLLDAGVANEAVSRVAREHDFVFDPYSIHIALQLALGHGRWSRRSGGRIPPDHLKLIAQSVVAVWTLLNTDQQFHSHPGGTIARMVERSLQGSPFQDCMTAWGMWCWSGVARVDAAARERADFEDACVLHAGCSLPDWIGTCSCLLLSRVVGDLNSVIGDSSVQSLPIPGVTDDANRKVQRAMRSLQGTRREARRLAADTSPLPLSPAGAVPSVLRRYPLLRYGRGASPWTLLSPHWLGVSALENPLKWREHTARLSGRPGLAGTQFGAIVEEYVHALCAHVFGASYQRLQRTDDSRRVDGVVWLSRGYILIECKAKRPPELVRYSGRTDEELAAELRSTGLADAVEQIESTARDVALGVLTSPCKYTDPLVASLIVVFHDVPASAAAGEVLDTLLPRSHACLYGKMQRPHLVTLQHLEQLAAWRDADWLQVLEHKSSSGLDAFEPVPDYMKVALKLRPTHSLYDHMYASMRAHISRCDVPPENRSSVNLTLRVEPPWSVRCARVDSAKSRSSRS